MTITSSVSGARTMDMVQDYYLSTTAFFNLSLSETSDETMKFGTKNIMVIATYANLMWISLLGNCVVLWKLHGRKHRSRVHFMLLHLCIADLLVTVVEMPLQIAWKSTVQWNAGDVVCRLLAGGRVIGLYLNAFLLMAISVDRFMSVWDPLSTARRATVRAKAMVFVSWILTIVCASPQLTVWSVKQHPNFPSYHQCVTFGAFQTRSAELAYGLWITSLMYGLPLITITVCYLGIWFRIYQYSRRSRQAFAESFSQPKINASTVKKMALVATHGDFLTTAKSRTLKMTALVVLIFIGCWTPYQMIHIWYYLDRESVEQVNQVVQEILFIFGVSSSVVDPYVYGLYSMGIWKEIHFFSKSKDKNGEKWEKRSRKISFTAVNGQRGAFFSPTPQFTIGKTLFKFNRSSASLSPSPSIFPATC